MGPLQLRTVSVSVTTYVATTVVLVLWLLAAVAVAIYLFLNRRKHAQRARSSQRTRSTGNTIPRFGPCELTARPAYPQRAQTPSSLLSRGPPSLSATARYADFSPVRTPPNDDAVPPPVPAKDDKSYCTRTTPVTPVKNRGSTPTVSPIKRPGGTTTVSPTKISGTTSTVSPTKTPLPTLLPSIHEEATLPRLVPATDTPSHFPTSAPVLHHPLAAFASDTTDMSAEASDREVVNEGYMGMLARRGVAVRDHALLGSDNSTDAGGGGGGWGTAAGLGGGMSYAMHAAARSRGGDGVAWGADVQAGAMGYRPPLGRSKTAGQRIGDGGDEVVVGVTRPLRVRKMPSV